MAANDENAALDAHTRAELDALALKRAPPDSLFFAGAGEYMATLLKPAMERDARERARFAQTQAAPAGGGPSAAPRLRVVQDEAHGRSLSQSLQHASATMSASEPVHFHDLKESADRKTQELLAAERALLHFRAYTMERVDNSPLENERARIMEFFFRIADGTLHVFEPAQRNSGLYQGDYAKRHVPFKADGSGSAYGPTDFFVGAEIPVSGRLFTIVDADAATRALMLERYGVQLAPPIEVPTPQFVPHVGGIVGHHPHPSKVVCDVGNEEDPLTGFYKKAPDTKGKFMTHGSATLRFEAEWRETSEPFGDRRRFCLQYSLSDDTLEVLDKTSPHSRGGQFSKFAKRQRMPRLPVEAGMEAAVRGAARPTSGASASEVVAMSNTARKHYAYTAGPNVWAKATSPITGAPIYEPTTGRAAAAAAGGHPAGPSEVSGFPVLTALAQSPAFITAADLVCGGVISVYGRPMLIKTCDPFTVAFGLQKLGIDQRRGFIVDGATTASERAAAAPQLVPRGVIPLPPHTGAMAVGSEEETRVNAYKMIPTYRSERDAAKLYQLQGKCLRFEARLDPRLCDPDDARREFVVSFFLEDDTLGIVEVLRDRKGASAVRWLSRGAHRNFRTPADPSVMRAVRGNLPGSTLTQDVQSAYDRVSGLPGDRFGYAAESGGGYSGGIFGRTDRVGPGGTGVASVADMGIRDATTHAWQPPAGLFCVDDFAEGAELQLAHAPGQTFLLGRGDPFTQSFLAARARQRAFGGGAGAGVDARDVYVPENRAPVPALPLEGAGAPFAGGDAAAEAAAGEGLAALGDEAGAGSLGDAVDAQCPPHAQQAALVVAKVLAGVLISAQNVVRQSDRNDRGVAPKAVLRQVLQHYGCRPPTCADAVVDTLLDAFVVGTGADCLARDQAAANARSTKHPAFRPSTPQYAPAHPAAGSPSKAPQDAVAAAAAARAPNLTEVNPLRGPELVDFFSQRFAAEPMVDYARVFAAVRAVTRRQQALQPRLEKLVSQLRAALLSSRLHLRRVFRDLDTEGKGTISFAEFRNLLLRHHLDVGMSDAQVRALMARFPPPAPPAAAVDARTGEPAISWRGFVETVLDAQTLAPGEIEQLIDFVRGVHDNDAADGVGGTRVWPEVFPHVNAVSSWSADKMDLARFGVREGPAGAGAAPPRAAAAAAPPQPPPRAGLAPGPGGPPRPATAAPSAAPVVPLLGAPELPASRPRSAPAGVADPRPAPERPMLDVVEALSRSAKGAEVLRRMRDAFGTRRIELLRALALFDTGRRQALTAGAFVEAVVSAGLRLTVVQKAELVREVCRLAGGSTGLVPPPNDVHIAYGEFVDALWES